MGAWRPSGTSKIAAAAAGFCVAAALGCHRKERGRSEAPPAVARADTTAAATDAARAAAVADAGAGESIAAAVAAGTHCFSFLDLKLPRAAAGQIEESVQRCAAIVPTQPGLENAHLRIRIEANGRVRDVEAFDPTAEPIGAPLMACIETASRAWQIPHGKKQCIEVAPAFGVIPFDILMPGYHHVDDLRAFKASRWWALCLDDDTGPPARPVRWSVSRVPNDSCFGDEGRDVKVQGCKKPLFLARRLAMPSARSLPLAELLPDTPDGGSGRPWPVTGRYDPVPWLAVDGETGRGQLDGRFAGQRWQVEIVSSKGEEDDAFLIAGGKRQWLFKASRNGIDVVWAGDLDGDGKLDLFIRDSDEGPTFYLFLSSAALPGELLHAVATGFASSC